MPMVRERPEWEETSEMEWWIVLLFFIGGLLLFLLLGFPVAFSFLLQPDHWNTKCGGITGSTLTIWPIFPNL